MEQGKILYFMQLFLHISFMVKILLFKLKNLYIQYTWFSIMKKQNNNQNVMVEKMVIFVKLLIITIPSLILVPKFNFGNFFSIFS